MTYELENRIAHILIQLVCNLNQAANQNSEKLSGWNLKKCIVEINYPKPKSLGSHKVICGNREIKISPINIATKNGNKGRITF